MGAPARGVSVVCPCLIAVEVGTVRGLHAGSVADAMRELEPLQGKKDVALAVSSCLVQLHKQTKYKGMLLSWKLPCR
jgi:hypothetical protein